MHGECYCDRLSIKLLDTKNSLTMVKQKKQILQFKLENIFKDIQLTNIPKRKHHFLML